MNLWQSIARHRRIVTGGVVLLVIALGFGALSRLTHEIRYDQVRAAVAALTARQIALSLGLTTTSYLALTFYDVLALRALHDVSRLIGLGQPGAMPSPKPEKPIAPSLSTSARSNPHDRAQFRRARSLRTRGDRAGRSTRIVRWTALMLGMLMVIAAAAPMLGLFGTSPYLIYRPQHQRIPIAAVMLSGDIGFRRGMSAPVATAWRSAAWRWSAYPRPWSSRSITRRPKRSRSFSRRYARP